MARKQGGTHRSVDDIIGAVLWSEAESGAITLHDDNPRVGGTSLTGDDVRVLVADLTRLRADVARLEDMHQAASRNITGVMEKNERLTEALAAERQRAEQAEQRLRVDNERMLQCIDASWHGTRAIAGDVSLLLQEYVGELRRRAESIADATPKAQRDEQKA